MREINASNIVVEHMSSSSGNGGVIFVVIMVMSSSISLLLLLLLGWDQIHHLGTACARGPNVPISHACEALVKL
jgi:hypothetical protein